MEPTNEQWSQLYEIAKKIRKQKPWQWLSLGQIFAIEDPETKVNYYCSVQTEERLDYVQILIGEDGLGRMVGLLESISRGEEFADDDEAYGDFATSEGLASYLMNFDEHSLNCFFTNKTHLSQYELDVLAQLNLRFSGSKQWISFKHIVPGQFTESVHDTEMVRILTVILEQVYEICAMEKEQNFIHNIFWSNTFTEIFTWRYNPESKRWQGGYITLEDAMAQMPIRQMDNQLELLKVRRLKGSKKVYELLRIYMPMPIEYGGILRFPLTFLLVDMDSGMIVWNHIDMGDVGYEQRLLQQLAGLFMREGQKPSRILTADYILYQIIVDFCEHSKIFLEYLVYTITGDEILDSFLESANVRHKDITSNIVDRDKEKNILGKMTGGKGTTINNTADTVVHKPGGGQIIDFRTRKPMKN